MNLREWIVDSCSRPGFADMHIDRFDPKWKDRARWIEGGASVLQEAVEARALANCYYKVAMVYTLQSSADILSMDFETQEEFHNQLDHSPPSVFIAEPGSEPWITSETCKGVQMVSLPESLVKRLFPVYFECHGLLMGYRSDGKQESVLTAWFLT